MAEWSNAAVSKTVVHRKANRGFESPSLRKSIKTAPSGAFFIFGKSIKFILMLLKKIKK